MRVYMILNIYDIHDGLYNHMMIVCIAVYVYMIYVYFFVMGIVYDTIFETPSDLVKSD